MKQFAPVFLFFRQDFQCMFLQKEAIGGGNVNHELLFFRHKMRRYAGKALPLQKGFIT